MEEVVYYDVCEDPEELQSMVHTGVQPTTSSAISQLKRRLHTLESKRGNICARRAYLRNKKVQAEPAARWSSVSSLHLLRAVSKYFHYVVLF